MSVGLRGLNVLEYFFFDYCLFEILSWYVCFDMLFEMVYLVMMLCVVLIDGRYCVVLLIMIVSFIF